MASIAVQADISNKLEDIESNEILEAAKKVSKKEVTIKKKSKKSKKGFAKKNLLRNN